MHIADGVMAPPIWLLGYAIAIPILAYGAKRTKKNLGPEQIPLLEVLTAGIFVAQILNFPIGGGTSGHFVGVPRGHIAWLFCCGIYYYSGANRSSSSVW